MIDEKLVHDYIRALDKHLKEGITEPKHLDGIIKNDKVAKALRNFINYLEDDLELIEFNGHSLDAWRKRIKIPRSGAREVYITDEELIEAFEKIRHEDVKLCFRLLCYSGLRLSHLLSAMNNFNPKNLIIKNSFARYPVSHTSKGKKRAYWMYFPSHLIDHLKPLTRAYRYYQNAIRHGRVDANSIRKWHLNFMIENGVPESVADFIQGRASVTVGSTHYLHKTKQADQFYAKIVDKFPI